MLLSIQDALLLSFVAAVIGLSLGLWLATWRHRRQRLPEAAHAAPRAPAVPGPPAVAPTPKPPTAALPQVADLLLVDDSAVARAKLRRLFERAGYQVHLASDGVEALALLHKGRYPLMITDLEMPNMDGVALIKACAAQADTAGMPILAITGHESLRAKFDECSDICGIHRKPWVDDILLSHVATLVGARRVALSPPRLRAPTASSPLASVDGPAEPVPWREA